MDITKLYPGTKWDDAYIIDSSIGQGSMAYIYKVNVDLSKFDFAHLISYWEAQKENVAFDNIDAYCKYRKDVWISQSPEELLHYCEANNICFPERKTCALKILKTNEHVERFLTEWQKTIGMYHPHLLQVYGGSKFQDCYYYSMELIENPYHLKKIYDTSINTKVRLILQAAKGLESLHNMSIIHRDVKIDNFIVYQNNGELHLKIADLGIAKNTDVNNTLANQLLGTPNFMAPEQVKNSKSVDYLCDIYSLGATFYEMICKKPPYARQSLQTILRNINQGISPIPATKLVEDLPPEINRIIKYLMAFKPSGRPQNMGEVQELLKNYLDGNYTNVHVAKETKKKIKKVPKIKRIPKIKTNLHRKRRVDTYKKNNNNNEKSTPKEMYLKLFAILLGPLLLIIYLLFPEIITSSIDEDQGIKKRRVIHDVIKRHPIKKRALTLEEKMKNIKPIAFLQLNLRKINGVWYKQEDRYNEWRGFTTAKSRNESILEIINLPGWKNYKITFHVKIISGSFSIQIRELNENLVLTDIFEDLKKYPGVTFKIIITILNQDILIERIVQKSNFSSKFKKLKEGNSILKKVEKTNQKNINLIIKSSGKFPGNVSIDQGHIRQIEAK